MNYPMVPIGMAFDITNGGTPKSSEASYWDGDIPWIGPSDMSKTDGRRIAHGARNLTSEGLDSCGAKRVAEGSMILSIRAPIGHLKVADRPIAFSQGCRALTARPMVHEDFAYWALDSVRPELEALGQGTTFIELARDKLRSQKIPVPHINKQAAIADYLDRETGRIDALIEEKGRFVALLREKRVAVVSHAVTRGLDPTAPTKPSGQDWLGDVPAHWDVVRLALLYREVERRGDLDAPVLSVSIHAGVSDDEIANEDRDRRVALSEDRSKYQGVLPGDLVYNMMRAWQGAFGAVRSPGLVSPAYVVAAPIENIRTKFVELQFRTPQAIEEMRRYSKGIADFRMRLYWEHLRDVKVAVPSCDEQDAILQTIDRQTTRIDALIAETERSIALLREKRAAEITAAVTGQIDVGNAA